MYYILLSVCLFIYYASAEITQDSSKYIYKSRNHGHLVKPSNNKIQKVVSNNTYYETPDNMMRVPVSQYNDELQAKKWPLKKTPKRTIQKIIKKNRKSKRMFFSHVTSHPTEAAANPDLLKEVYVPELEQREDGVSTTQVNQRKKARNRNSKMSRYPMPFQRLQQRHDNGMLNYKRMRRGTDRDNTLIVQDFDEIKFLDHKKDYDVIKVHAKKYW